MISVPHEKTWIQGAVTLLNLLEIIILFPEYNDRCYNPLGGCTKDERQRGNSTGIYWTEGNKQVQVLFLYFVISWDLL